ncbi:MAG: pirin family protein [Bacteroidales bacterium]|nr:pirin family protein [Bacteroidales bacterium]
MKTILERANERGYGKNGWLTTYYSFSFANYHNPNRMGFGALRVLNDDVVEPLHGFEMHPHKNMEVITLPLKGSLHHSDSKGHQEMLRWGQMQVMSTGAGMYHSEFNDKSSKVALELIQIWIVPKEMNTPPKYKVWDIYNMLKEDAISVIISPDGETPISILQDAWLSIGEFNPETKLNYQLHKENNGVYIFVLGGELLVESFSLGAKDGLGISKVDSFSVEAIKKSSALFIEVPMD